MKKNNANFKLFYNIKKGCRLIRIYDKDRNMILYMNFYDIDDTFVKIIMEYLDKILALNKENTLPEEDFETINNKYYKPFSKKVEEVEKITDEVVIYTYDGYTQKYSDGEYYAFSFDLFKSFTINSYGDRTAANINFHYKLLPIIKSLSEKMIERLLYIAKDDLSTKQITEKDRKGYFDY